MRDHIRDAQLRAPSQLVGQCLDRLLPDIVGRRVPSPKLPWSREKSVAGSLSVFTGGWLLTVFIFAVYIWMGEFAGPLGVYLLPITWVALGATLVESLPYKDIDNITIALASVLVGGLVF